MRLGVHRETVRTTACATHLDFLMMTGLLFVFFLLVGQLRLTPPTAFSKY